MASKWRIFVCFAVEDTVYRDFLVRQAKDERSPFEWTDMSVKQPWDTKWKTNCKTRIKGCDGLIALISSSTWNADGARWEMKCASEEGIPSIGMQVQKNSPGAVPPELSGPVIQWEWGGIKAFLDTL